MTRKFVSVKMSEFNFNPYGSTTIQTKHGRRKIVTGYSAYLVRQERQKELSKKFAKYRPAKV